MNVDTFSATNSNYSLQHVPIIERDALVILNSLSKGAFGEVFVADWRRNAAAHGSVRVAVKKLHDVHVDAQVSWARKLNILCKSKIFSQINKKQKNFERKAYYLQLK